MATEAVLGAGALIAGISIAPIIAGFGTVGIAAGSTAAAIQSVIGCVQAGSWFARLTSLGMQGAGAGVAIIGGAVVAEIIIEEL